MRVGMENLNDNKAGIRGVLVQAAQYGRIIQS